MVCEHLYGYSEGFADPTDPDYEAPGLVLDKDLRLTADEVFNYCPRCGVHLQPSGATE